MISAEQGLCGGRGERFPRRLGFALVASRCGRGWQSTSYACAAWLRHCWGLGARATVCGGPIVSCSKGSAAVGCARRRASRVAGSRAAALARLSELDRRILLLVSTQRVLTQTQLARLLAEVPERTLRYRTERLFQLGLLGRSRPYREAGSHPFHLWPTRQADAFVRGGPVPRGGERAEPNPLFLAHAAAVSELYVLLATGAAEGGLALRGFRREGETREPSCASGRERALAPDALIDLDDKDGRQLLAFVELDLGTMSRPRLRVKAAGYAAYVYERAWGQRHPFCPALLFLTTGEARALAFLKVLASELARLGRGRWQRDEQERWFAAAACAHAHEPARALSESAAGMTATSPAASHYPTVLSTRAAPTSKRSPKRRRDWSSARNAATSCCATRQRCAATCAVRNATRCDRCSTTSASSRHARSNCSSKATANSTHTSRRRCR